MGFVHHTNGKETNPPAGPLQSLRVPEGWRSQISWESAREYGKVVSLTYRPFLLISVKVWVDTGRIISMKNGTPDLPVCSVVPQPTASPSASFVRRLLVQKKKKKTWSLGNRMCVRPQVKGWVTNSGNSIELAGLNLWACPGLFKCFKCLTTRVLKYKDFKDYMWSAGV